MNKRVSVQKSKFCLTDQEQDAISRYGFEGDLLSPEVQKIFEEMVRRHPQYTRVDLAPDLTSDQPSKPYDPVMDWAQELQEPSRKPPERLGKRPPIFDRLYFEYTPDKPLDQLAIMIMCHRITCHESPTAPFKVTLRQPNPNLEAIPGIIRRPRVLGGFDYKIDLSKVSCTVDEHGLKVGRELISLGLINKARLGWKEWRTSSPSQELLREVVRRWRR